MSGISRNDYHNGTMYNGPDRISIPTFNTNVLENDEFNDIM